MKKILAFVVLFSFLIIPQLSLAKNIIADSDLGAIFAQGSVTIIYDDINITSKTLKTTSTDGLDFWGDDHASFFGPAHPDYERTDSGAYVGYADVYLTGGLVKRSGSVTLECFNSKNDPTAFDYTNVSSLSRLSVEINSMTIDTGSVSIDAAIKLGTTPDLAGNQYLGHTHTSGVSATTNGSLSVYAHNNTIAPLSPLP